VDHLEGLAVVATDADLQGGGAVLAFDHPGHLEPEDLPGHDAVLADDLRAGIGQQERELLRRRCRDLVAGVQRRRLGPAQATPVDGPDGRCRVEQLGAASQDVGGLVGQDVEVLDLVADRPGEGRTEGTGRIVTTEEPAGRPRARRRAAREEAGLRLDLGPELGDEGPELGGVERRSLLGRERRAQDSAGASA
jgi:hypothetical protein